MGVALGVKSVGPGGGVGWISVCMKEKGHKYVFDYLPPPAFRRRPRVFPPIPSLWFAQNDHQDGCEFGPAARSQ